MSIFRRAHAVLIVVAAASAALLAGCAEAPPPPPPPVVIAPPPPPPISLATAVTDLAAGYQAYMEGAGMVASTFSTPEQVQDSVRVGAAYEPRQLVGGAVAYAAVVALQDPAFVAGVRTFVNDPAQRRAVAAEIYKDPAYVVGFKGADSAAGLIVDSLYGQGLKVYSVGRAVKISAYEVQRQSWSKANVVDQPGRLARVKTLSSIPARGTMDAAARLQLASTGAAPLAVSPRVAKPPYTPMVIRGLAVAALAALGEAGDSRMDWIQPLLAEPNSAQCLSMSKLNLYQCLAVAKPHYEDVFCLGQHILMDTGQCMIKGAGGPTPIEIYPRDLDLKAARAFKPARARAAAPAKKPAAKKG